MRTMSTIVRGEPCRVTEPLNEAYQEPTIYVGAPDATLTALQRDGRQWRFVVRCDTEAQAEHVEREMAKRDDMGPPDRFTFPGEPPEGLPWRLVPFRLLGRRWLAEWQETEDRIEVVEGASGSLYCSVVIDAAAVAERRIPYAMRTGAEGAIAALRGMYPGLWLFDFRPVRAA